MFFTLKERTLFYPVRIRYLLPRDRFDNPFKEAVWCTLTKQRFEEVEFIIIPESSTARLRREYLPTPPGIRDALFFSEPHDYPRVVEIKEDEIGAVVKGIKITRYVQTP